MNDRAGDLPQPQTNDERSIMLVVMEYGQITLSLVLLFTPLTYIAFYAPQVIDPLTALPVGPVGAVVILTLAVVVFIGLAAGTMGRYRFAALNAELGAVLVGGHIVWSIVTLEESAAFVLSNLPELCMFLVLGWLSWKIAELRGDRPEKGWGRWIARLWQRRG